MQVVDQHPPGLLVTDDGELGEALEQHRRGARVVLLHVMDDEVVGRRQLVELSRQLRPLDRVDGVDEGVLLAALHEVGVVAGAVGRGIRAVEQTAVPIDGADQVDVVADQTWLHGHPHSIREQARCISPEYIHEGNGQA